MISQDEMLGIVATEAINGPDHIHNPSYPCSCEVVFKGKAYSIRYCEQHAAVKVRGLLQDGAKMFGTLTGQNLEVYARTWAVLASAALSKFNP